MENLEILNNKLIEQFKNNNFINRDTPNQKIDLIKAINNLYNQVSVPQSLIVSLISTNYSLTKISEDDILEDLIDINNVDTDWCKAQGIIPLYIDQEDDVSTLIINCYNPLLYYQNKKNINDFLFQIYHTSDVELVISTKDLFNKILDNISLIKQQDDEPNQKKDLYTIEINEFLKDMFVKALTQNISEIHFEFKQNNSDSFIKFKQFDDFFIYSILEYSEKTKSINETINTISNTETDDFGIMNLELTNLQNINIKTSKIKTYYGEKYVFKIIKPLSYTSYQELNYPTSYLENVNKFLNFKNGIFFLLGDYGSGKKTFIFNYLNQTNKLNNKNVYILEKPYLLLNKFNYIASFDANDCFNKLNIIKQQSPNLIILDDYHDRNVLEKAFELSKYCLVFITINLPNISFLPDYLLKNNINFDINVKPYIRVVQEQVKHYSLCPYCKELIYKVDARRIIEYINSSNKAILRENTKLYKPKGCIKCNNIGFKEKLFFYNIHEFIDLKEMSNETKPNSSEINYLNFRNNYSSILEDLQLGNIFLQSLL